MLSIVMELRLGLTGRGSGTPRYLQEFVVCSDYPLTNPILVAWKCCITGGTLTFQRQEGLLRSVNHTASLYGFFKLFLQWTIHGCCKFKKDTGCYTGNMPFLVSFSFVGKVG
jgi:hypothetical protein